MSKFVLDTFNVDLLAPLSWKDAECDEALAEVDRLRPAISLAISRAVATTLGRLALDGVTIHVKPGAEVGEESEVAA